MAYRFYWYILFGVFLTTNVHAINIEDLLDSHELKIRVSVKPDKPIAREPITIVVDVLTNRWFAGGTRLQRIEIDQAIIMPSSELAINGIEKINRETWAVQSREITLYALAGGLYELPPIGIEVSVNTEQHGVVSGLMHTDGLNFTVTIPDELAGIDEYIVSSELSINIEDSFNNQETFELGNAVTRRIEVKAKDIPGMMIPEFSTSPITGVSIYHQPAQVSDDANRGSITGTRIESTTYIFEQAGNFVIPERIIYWWDKNYRILKQATIPEVSWKVLGGLNTSISTDSDMPIIESHFMACLYPIDCH